jgi:hypothetical protein
MENANDTLIAGLLALNERILQAEEKDAKDEITSLLHKDFTIIRASGVKQDRQTFLDAVSSNANRGRTAEQPEVRLYGGCAVFTCIVMTMQNPDGSPNTGRFWNTRLFVPEQRQWYCVVWQATKINQP